MRKLKALKENKAKPAEAHKAVELAVGAAQHVETEEELRKRKEQKQKEAKAEIQQLILAAVGRLGRAEGTDAKLLLQKAEKLAREHGITIQHVDLGEQIATLIAAEKYKRTKGSTEWNRVCGEVKTLLQKKVFEHSWRV